MKTIKQLISESIKENYDINYVIQKLNSGKDVYIKCTWPGWTGKDRIIEAYNTSNKNDILELYNRLVEWNNYPNTYDDNIQKYLNLSLEDENALKSKSRFIKYVNQYDGMVIIEMHKDKTMCQLMPFGKLYGVYVA